MGRDPKGVIVHRVSAMEMRLPCFLTVLPTNSWNAALAALRMGTSRSKTATGTSVCANVVANGSSAGTL